MVGLLVGHVLDVLGQPHNLVRLDPGLAAVGRVFDDTELALHPTVLVVQKSDAIEALILMQALVLPGLAAVGRMNDGGLRTHRPDLIRILAAAYREQVFAHALGRVDFIPGLAAISRAQNQRSLAADNTVVGSAQLAENSE